MVNRQTLATIFMFAFVWFLGGCAELVTLTEFFTDIDEHIASELSDDNGPVDFYTNYRQSGRGWETDDHIRFPNAEEDCETYREKAKEPGLNLFEKEYFRAMAASNCNAW